MNDDTKDELIDFAKELIRAGAIFLSFIGFGMFIAYLIERLISIFF